MKEKLLANGWEMFHECDSCVGHRQYFSNKAKKGYEIRTRVKNNTFSILLNNTIIAGPFWGYQVEEKLKQYVS